MAPAPSKLQISIPTYNRPLELQERCSELLHQLNDSVRLVIYDNSSSPPVREGLSAAILSSPYITISRNDINIGGDANIIRAIEYAHSEWVWLLGDDDRVHPQAVAIILNKIASVSDEVGAIKFSSPCGKINSDYELELNNMKSAPREHFFIANLLFISTTVVRKSAIDSYEQMYGSISSMASQLVMMITMIVGGWKVAFCSSYIIVDVAPGGWSIVEFEANFIRGAKYGGAFKSNFLKVAYSIFSCCENVGSIILFYKIGCYAQVNGRYKAKGIYTDALIARNFLARNLDCKKLFLDLCLFFAFRCRLDIPFVYLAGFFGAGKAIKRS